MITKVLSDSGERDSRFDSEAVQMLLGTNSGEHQDLRRIIGARRDNYFLARKEFERKIGRCTGDLKYCMPDLLRKVPLNSKPRPALRWLRAACSSRLRRVENVRGPLLLVELERKSELPG